MDLAVGQAQQCLQGLHVFVVLTQRVLELLTVPEDFLSPLGLVGTAENPALHVLGFHHKHTEGRDDDVVNLGGTVFGGQGDVANQVVGLPVEKQAGGHVHPALPYPALEPRGFHQGAKDGQREKKPQKSEKGLKRW